MTPEQLKKGKELEAEIKKLQEYIHPIEIALDGLINTGLNDNEPLVYLHLSYKSGNQWKDKNYSSGDDDCPEFLADKLTEVYKTVMIGIADSVKIRIKELELEMIKL